MKDYAQSVQILELVLTAWRTHDGKEFTFQSQVQVFRFEFKPKPCLLLTLCPGESNLSAYMSTILFENENSDTSQDYLRTK